MAPRRHQPARQAHSAVQVQVGADVLAKRTKRHLAELERSNYAEHSAGIEDDEDDSGKTAKGRARQTISDKRNISGSGPGAKRKKSTMNIRTAVLYRKKLAELVEESHIADLPPHIPTYLTAVTAPPREPPRLLCSVCGYWGRYKCRKCAMPYCDLNCEAVHDETRCEKRVV